ncbi:MAG: MFS transporter [Marinobacterium sp.]|nr:MFS transporter [Marinobacterium sp.]
MPASADISSRVLALASLCIATFLIPQAMSAVNIALPTIAQELQADAVAVSWLSTINLWGSVVLMLPAGRLADMLGRKAVYLTGTGCFAAASLLVLLPQSVESLLLIRLLQGLASSLVFGTAMAMASALAQDNNRGMWLGFVSTSVYLGLTCGPLLGGWLTETLGWRSVFLAPVPLLVLAIMLVMFTIRGDWKSADKGRFDRLGALLFAGWTSAFFFALAGLPDWKHLLLLAFGVLLVWLFIRQQLASTHPLVNLRALKQNRVLNRSMLAGLFMYGAHAPLLLLFSLYMQLIQGLSPALSGQLILLQALMMACFAPLAGRLSDRFEPRLIATTGCALFSSGYLLLLGIDSDTSMARLLTALLLLGIGFGLFSSPNNNAALSAVSKDRLSIATALLSLARTLGNMFSMAIVVLLFNHLLGGTELTPEQAPALQQVLQLALIIGLGYGLIATWCSWTRGTSAP